MTVAAPAIALPDADSTTMPAALSFVAGMVDVTGWMTLGGLFTAHITGNLVVIAADSVAGRSIHAAQILAVPLFIGVTAAIGIIVRSLRIAPSRLETILIGLQSALLLAATIVAVITLPSQQPFGLAAGIVAMLAVAAMASQNALLHLSRQRAPTTAVMTGNIVVCVLSLVSVLIHRSEDSDAARSQWRQTWPILLGFLAGCVTGAGAVTSCGEAGWFAAAIASIGIAVLRSAVRARSKAITGL